MSLVQTTRSMAETKKGGWDVTMQVYAAIKGTNGKGNQTWFSMIMYRRRSRWTIFHHRLRMIDELVKLIVLTVFTTSYACQLRIAWDIMIDELVKTIV